ncbi:MAG TPA: DUF6519 domain-containing protein [Tepidisphaeraceae bacterium]|jgi:hypothetical protein|nr:DUF6519 domain-containing protein [Tepidisphaeraceae bacterium]
MKGDFSRIRFNGRQNYTEVLQQQGRVALDADANEQSAIIRRLRDREIGDIVGPFGGPGDDPGFAISISNNSIAIGPGRYYVNGILCENPTPLTYTTQPFLMLGPHDSTDTALLTDLQRDKSIAAVQVYLEVWERLVTPLDAPCLREPALGQADTTVRRQTVWRVVAEPQATRQTTGRIVSIDHLVLDEFPARVPVRTPVDCCISMYNPPANNTTIGTLCAQTTGGSDDCSCEPTPAAGYRGLENQLYRIEIHQGGDETKATFKWSRENASVVAAVNSVSGSAITVDNLGPDDNLGFTALNWVELTDDTNQFGLMPNQPGELLQIQTPSQANLSLTFPAAVPSVDTTKHAKVRRWDQLTDTANGIPLAPGTWIDLENGIQVQFAPGTYTSGDYWLIPARTATGQIEWPPCDSEGSPFQKPHQTLIHRAPLACIHWTPQSKQFTVEDCRRIFWPLTTDALHVTNINWANDDFISLDTDPPDNATSVGLALAVALDQAPDSPIKPAIFRVAMEVPFNNEKLVLSGPAIPRSEFILDGVCSLLETNLLWKYTNIITFLNIVLPPWKDLAARGIYVRVRVTLTGHCIFKTLANKQIYLDGQSFGAVAASDASLATRPISLLNPSGNGARASDFDSWFYLRPLLKIVSISVQTNPVSNPPTVNQNFGGAPESSVTATVTFNFPAPAGTTVYLWLTLQPGHGDSVLTIQSPFVVQASTSSITVPITFDAPTPNSGLSQTYLVNASLLSQQTQSDATPPQLLVTGSEQIR